jgi:hypothetical protein
MKYIHIALFGAILAVSGCKTQTANMVTPDPYANVNIDYVRANCKPVENYQFPVFGVYALPARLKDCAGVADMFLVAWPGENGEVEQTIAKLLTLLYVKSNNERQDPDLTATFIKHNSTEDGSMHASFYELNEVKPPEPVPQEDTTQ